MSFESDIQYIATSVSRFLPKDISDNQLKSIYEAILNRQKQTINTELDLFTNEFMVAEKIKKYQTIIE